MRKFGVGALHAHCTNYQYFHDDGEGNPVKKTDPDDNGTNYIGVVYEVNNDGKGTIIGSWDY